MNVSPTYESYPPLLSFYFLSSLLSSPNYFKLQPPKDDSAAQDAGGFFAQIDPSDFGHFDPEDFGKER